jgi:hypothetical protein
LLECIWYFNCASPGSPEYCSLLGCEGAVEMEDPAREVEGVIRALVVKPTLQQQKETLEKYFTEDVELYHFVINLNTGLKALIAIYQVAELLLNYRFAIISI